jgi:hypothetical protein
MKEQVIKIVSVFDAEMVADFIGTPNGEKMILEIISRWKKPDSPPDDGGFIK